MTETIDLLGIGNAITDNLCRSSDDELKKNGLIKGSMALIDGQKAAELQSTVSPVSRQSGGSVSNSVVHFAKLGGRSQFIGKVANDDAGTHYIDELIREGVEYSTSFLNSGISTGRCYVFVTPDGQRTMCTYLGASSELS
ncbi:MAG: adenosine kinase, partial [Gammaproteobacteria bacterium]|nr:adenosine kinase [Gammaproteobacteria bacterium]